jgi:hypothetical protein
MHVFVVTLGYSRRARAEGYETGQKGALLDAHAHASRISAALWLQHDFNRAIEPFGHHAISRGRFLEWHRVRQ